MGTSDRVNILLVDDQPAKLLSYEAILEDLGENLLKAGSATEALEHLLRKEIAVVLADVCMPDLDGYELAKMIREHPRCQRTSIIFVSAVLMNDPDRLRGYQAGAVDYVPVPVVPEILRAKVGVFAELYRKTRQLELFNRELEERVRERTAELEATTAKLQEADRRKDDFLAVLSHELRNPMTPIRNSLFVLSRASPGSEQAERARSIIERQISHMARLVDDLLDVTRISRGKIDLHKAPVNLEAMVRRTLDDYREVLVANGLDLGLNLPAESLEILGDATRLSQVLGNLLQNAAKFTPRGGRVDLSITRSDDHAELCVSDTGVGISPELLPRLFAPFAQGPQSPDRKLGGLGLGLSLVKGLVEMHGGEVQASSDGPGKGAKFRLRLPLHAAPPRPDSAPLRLVRLVALRILVVEDNRDAAESLGEVLELWGHEVELAKDGEEGIAHARRLRPDVVLCDIGLPRISGYDVAKTLRVDPSLSGTVLVALSGYAQPSDKRQALEAGFHRHMSKPPSLPELERFLAEVVAKAESA